MTRKGRFHKVSKLSDGYKKGIRYIDFGENANDKIRYLTKKPDKLKRRK